MRFIVGHARVYLVFLSLVAVVACFSGKGFGKNAADTKKKTSTATAPTAPEQRYLGPFGLELFTNGEQTNKNDDQRKVRSLVDRTPGDVLLEIPSRDVLTAQRIRSRLEAESCDAKYKDDNNFDVEEEALALGLLQWKQSGLDPYVTDVLPEHHGNAWTLPENSWKTVSSDVLPRCYSETFAATRQRANEFATAVAEARGYSVDEALWAFSMVRSRSLAVPELMQPGDEDGGDSGRIPLALIPGLDLLNHRFGSGTTLQLVVDDNDDDDDGNDDATNSRWIVSSSESIAAGDEVFLSYGHDKDNWKLLLTYGFCLPDNPNAIVFWTWEDLLDAAHTARPSTFSEPVCKQLLRHPQLTAYTVQSEDRATFSYDAASGTPRESLSNGLVMLNSLASQLGKPEPDPQELSAAVLAALVDRRLEELGEGLAKLDEHLAASKKDSNNKHNQSSTWDTFFDSLRVALRAEERQLQSQDQ